MKRRRLEILLTLSVFMFGPWFSGASANETLADALAGHANGEDVPKDFSLIAECRHEGQARTVEIAADGMAIWGRRTQFSLSPDDTGNIVALLNRYDFARMPDIFGGAVQPENKDDRPTVIRDEEPGANAIPAPVSAKEIPAAVIITCRVVLTLNGIEKQVLQRARGIQSKQFREMTTAILNVCEGPAGNGVGANSLGEGLEKLAAGKLAARMLRLLVHRKIGRPNEGARHGWLLRIEDGRARARTYDSQGALDEVTAVELDDKRLADIVELLSRNNVGSMPINIQARDYTELVVEILNQRRGIQARRFAKDAGHPEGVEEFENIVDGLELLYRYVLEEGT